MRYLLIFFIVISTLLGVDLELEDEPTDINRDLSINKIYFGKSLFQGKFKDNRELRYNSNYIINVGDEVSIKL